MQYHAENMGLLLLHANQERGHTSSRLRSNVQLGHLLLRKLFSIKNPILSKTKWDFLKFKMIRLARKQLF